MKLNCIRFIGLILLLCTARILQAQDFSFSNLTSGHGLSEGVVNCVMQDKRGFMWFGTQDGLNCYDGYKVVVYKHHPADTNSISNNFVYSLFEDSKGIIWIGTNAGGVDAFNPVNGRFIHYRSNEDPNSLPSNSIHCIYEDSDGLMWFGTEEGACSFNRISRKFSRYQSTPSDSKSISNNNAWSITEDEKGMIWIGTNGGGLNSLDRKSGKFHRFVDQFKDESTLKIRDMSLDKEGVLWIATYGGGLLAFDTYKKIFLAKYDNETKGAADGMICIEQQSQDRFWIGTYGGGIKIFDKKSKKFVGTILHDKTASGLVNNNIKCIYVDRLGDVWIGTEAGISTWFHDINKFKVYRSGKDELNGMKSNTVMALMKDAEGEVWIGTSGGGLSSLNRTTGKYQHYPQLSTATNNSVLALCQSSDGLIWVGTWGGWLNSYDKKTKKVQKYRIKHGLTEGNILNVVEDVRGTLWVGSYGDGIFAYDPSANKFIGYNKDAGLNNGTIFCIHPTKSGKLWLGTEGGGIMLFDPLKKKVVKSYERDSRDKNSLSSNLVNCIYEDPQGNVWIGTAEGLNRLDASGNFTVWYEKDGLPNDYIYSILPDKNGNLWITTNKGLSKFDPSLKNEEGSAFRNYNAHDGLQGLEFDQGAYFLAPDGEIFIGGVNGFNSFFPDQIKDNPHVPPVYITSFKLFGKEEQLDSVISYKKYIKLNWRQNFFAFEFAGLDFQMPSKNKYQYMLEGVNEDWVPVTDQRFASYPQLPGGDYIFKVRASNNDGIWNKQGAELHIYIVPPFWKTTWFYTLCVIAVLAGILAFVQYRTYTFKKENKLLESKVHERTKELEQKNKDITSSIEYAKRIQEAILPSQELIFSHFPEAFIFYQPKDIVSGDFYWFAEKNGRKIIAMVDCTGHGVPGAFMSMIGHNLLNQIVQEKNVVKPAEILIHLHQGVQKALKQGSTLSADGMDVSICSVDKHNQEIQYAGAFRPLYIVDTEKGLQRIEPDKYPIGGAVLDLSRNFTNKILPVKKGSTFYMFSDGYADQFGGEYGKKFMMKQFNELISTIQHLPMAEQGTMLKDTINKWMGTHEQVDDILVIGIKL